MELNRIPQIRGVGKCTDLQVVILVKADDFPGIADRRLQGLPFALEEAIGQAAVPFPS